MQVNHSEMLVTVVVVLVWVMLMLGSSLPGMKFVGVGCCLVLIRLKSRQGLPVGCIVQTPPWPRRREPREMMDCVREQQMVPATA